MHFKEWSVEDEKAEQSGRDAYGHGEEEDLTESWRGMSEQALRDALAVLKQPTDGTHAQVGNQRQLTYQSCISIVWLAYGCVYN